MHVIPTVCQKYEEPDFTQEPNEQKGDDGVISLK